MNGPTPGPVGVRGRGGGAISIAVVGCGAMGSVYAARLADAGNHVVAVTRRSEQAVAINEQGLRVTGPDREIVARIAARDTVPDVPVDLVIVAVKAAAVPTVARRITRLIGDRTVVLALQNGLGSADELAAHVDPDRIAVGVASGFGASMRDLAHAHHNAMRAIRFGPYAGLDTAVLEDVAAVWRAAGFDAASVDDIVAMQWRKLICNVAYSAPCALSGMTVGQVLEHEHMGAVSRAAATEAWEVARRLGVGLDVDDPVELVTDFGSQMPDARPSALQDMEAGRVGEIDVINGAVPREAAKVGMTAPVNATLSALVRTREESFVDTSSGRQDR